MNRPKKSMLKKMLYPIRPKRGNNCQSNFLSSTALPTMALQYQDFMTFPKDNSIYFLTKFELTVGRRSKVISKFIHMTAKICTDIAKR